MRRHHKPPPARNQKQKQPNLESQGAGSVGRSVNGRPNPHLYLAACPPVLFVEGRKPKKECARSQREMGRRRGQVVCMGDGDCVHVQFCVPL